MVFLFLVSSILLEANSGKLGNSPSFRENKIKKREPTLEEKVFKYLYRGGDYQKKPLVAIAKL